MDMSDNTLMFLTSKEYDSVLGFVTVCMTILVVGSTILLRKMFYRMGPVRNAQPVDSQYVDVIAAVRQSLQPSAPDLAEENDSLQMSMPRQRRGDMDTCPICLDAPSLALETNCGHGFCGNCFLAYIETMRRSAPVACPICRREVSLLLHNFNEQERRTTSDLKTRILTEIHTYNNRYSGRPVPWSTWIRDFPTLARHMVTDFFTWGGLATIYRLRLLFCFIIALLYLLSPLDLIPEAAFGLLGLIDDGLILLMLLVYCVSIYRIAVQNRAN